MADTAIAQTNTAQTVAAQPIAAASANPAKHDSAEKRNPSWWKPGQCPNPKGRPTKGNAIAEVYRDILNAESVTFKIIGKDMTEADVVIRGLPTIRHRMCLATLHMALTGDMAAIKEISERTEGKVKDLVGVTNDNVTEIVIAGKPRTSTDVADGTAPPDITKREPEQVLPAQELEHATA